MLLEEGAERALHLAPDAHGADVVGGVRLRQVVARARVWCERSASSRVRPLRMSVLEGGRGLGLDEERRERLVRAAPGSAAASTSAPASRSTPARPRSASRAPSSGCGLLREPEHRDAEPLRQLGTDALRPGGGGMLERRPVLPARARGDERAVLGGARERPELVHRVREGHRAVAREHAVGGP